MSHFAKQDGFNALRLPVAWKFLVNNVCGAELHAENFAEYDALVQACLATGGWCITSLVKVRMDGARSLWEVLAESFADVR